MCVIFLLQGVHAGPGTTDGSMMPAEEAVGSLHGEDVKAMLTGSILNKCVKQCASKQHNVLL